MTSTTVIDSVGTVISSARNEDTEALRLSRNKKISFLPENPADAFPNLIFIEAAVCSIKAISRQNFVGLKKLRAVNLIANQIESINSDTFADVLAMERIQLGKSADFFYFIDLLLHSKPFPDDNKISSLNGEAFAQLTKLIAVNLRSNECIDQGFMGKSLSRLVQVVTENCGFIETIKDIEIELSTQAPQIESENRTCEFSRIRELENKIAEMSETIEKLQSDLHDARVSKSQDETQSILMKELYDKLEAHLKDGFTTRMEAKLQEIETCNKDLQIQNERVEKCEA